MPRIPARGSLTALLLCLLSGLASGTARADDPAAPVTEQGPALHDAPDANRLTTGAAEGKPLDPERKTEPTLPVQKLNYPSPYFPQNVRQPVGVGIYYEADRQILMRQLAALDDTRPITPVPGLSKVFLAPWGAMNGALPTAALAYRYIRDSGGGARTVLLVARPHTVSTLSHPAVVWPNGGFATPVGITNINTLAVMTLLRNPLFAADLNAHLVEASIETHVLLMQHFLPDATIVPILIAPRSKEEEVNIAQTLARAAAAHGVRLMFLSNLSGGFATPSESGKIDLQTLTALSTMDLNIINETGKTRDARLPARAGSLDAPRVVMAAVLAALTLEMDTATWLGYAAVRQPPEAPLLTGCAAGAFSARAARPEPAPNVATLLNDKRETAGLPGVPGAPGSGELALSNGRLSAEAEFELTKTVRDSLEAAAAGARYDTPYPRSPELMKKRAVYVTVYEGKTGQHLASMGFLGPQMRLNVAAAEAARMCALGEDPQTPLRLTPEQAQYAKLVISVIRDVKTAGNWQEVQNGDGIVLARGEARCVVLPCTAKYHHWSAEDALSFASKHSGLRPEAYRLPQVNIFTFQTDEYVSPAPTPFKPAH